MPEKLPINLYTAAQVRALDQIAIEEHGIPGSTLMARAAQTAFKVLSTCWPAANKIAVVCGIGNNAGDGFVLARIAQPLGYKVTVLLAGSPEEFKGDCLEAHGNLQGTETIIKNFENDDFSTFDLIVDALFGSGLSRSLDGIYKTAVEAINNAKKPVLSLDIPSGLCADTGTIWGATVRADATVCFVGLKQGLFTADGPDHAGVVFFDDLKIPNEIYRHVPCGVSRLDLDLLLTLLSPRQKNAHKGSFGHALIVGGDEGMTGALRLACEATPRVGTGLVSAATREVHAATINITRPEIMSIGTEKVKQLKKKLQAASVIAVGPGLGQTHWAELMWRECIKSAQPLVVDADALNLLARKPFRRSLWILTPHPGEAARLLNSTAAEIQKDRFGAVKELQKKFSGVIVLKGRGSLVCDGQTTIGLCAQGNPGMASGGMGDALTGMITGLIAQGLNPSDAAKLGVCLHAAAADIAAEKGERGLLALDLMDPMRQLIKGAQI